MAATRPPVQLPLGFTDVTPTDGPTTPMSEAWHQAIAASHRLLDGIEQRAKQQSGLRDADRAASLAAVQRRRRRLEVAARRAGESA